MSRRPLLATCVCALLSACAAVGPSYAPPLAPVAPAFRTAPTVGAPAAVAARWWEGFRDPALNRLVEQALARNLDLDQAIARVLQARASARSASAALLPTGQLNTQAAHVRQSLAGTGAGSAAAFGRDIDLFDLNAGASWELDLFGGLRRGREAASADLQASELGLAAARLTVAADTTDAYLQLRGFQARLGVTERRAADDRHLLELVSAQYDAGHLPRLQRDQAQAVLAQTEAAAPLLRAGIEAQLNRLAILTGVTPESDRGGLQQAAALPEPPGPPPGLTPADLLRRRPDVAAAERRLAGANARIGTAIADYYPKVSLQGLLGLQSLSLGRLISGSALQGQAAAGLRWRLFDFGRVDSEVASARGAYAEQLAVYRLAVLRAAEDVETALAAFAERGAQLERLRAATTALEQARSAAQAGYEGGAISFIEVIDAERQLFATEDALATARTEQARAAVAFNRALGASL